MYVKTTLLALIAASITSVHAADTFANDASDASKMIIYEPPMYDYLGYHYPMYDYPRYQHTIRPHMLKRSDADVDANVAASTMGASEMATGEENVDKYMYMYRPYWYPRFWYRDMLPYRRLYF